MKSLKATLQAGLTAPALSICIGLATLMHATAATGGAPLSPPAGLGFDKPQAKLLILGTFHFRDAGLDGYKPQHEVDIFSPQRQEEVGELLDRLAAFAPTTIAVEMDRTRQPVLDERYAKYLAGEFKLSSNEIYQLGFRLGKRLGHERLFAVDADGRHYEPSVDSVEFAQVNDQAWILDHEWDKRYEALYAWGDRQKMQATLRDFLLYLNSPERLRLGHGHYLTGAFKATDGNAYPGADHLSGWWYNRNLRIFANLLHLARKPDDRLLLIVGAGHVPILRHAALSAPDVTLVDVADVLGDPVQDEQPSRTFGNGVFVSDADPALRMRIAPGFEYLGQDNFLLGDSGTHGVERHHWVKTKKKRVTAMITIQFEQILPGVPGQYEFNIPQEKFIAGGNYRFSPQPVRLGAHDYVHNTWAFDTRASAKENPGKESDRTLRLLARHGYEIDDGLIMSRYVRAVGEKKRKEVIVFYLEPLSEHGHTLDEFPDNTQQSAVFDRLAARIVARGMKAFELEGGQ